MNIRRRKFLDWLKNRGGLRIFSILVAVAAWVVVNSGQMAQQRHSIRLQYLQLPKGLVFQRNPLKEVKVDLTGSLYQLRRIRDEDLIYPIDLSSVTPGVQHIEVDLESLKLPLEIEASHINPRSFNIHIEELYAQSLPLKPVFIGKAREGFQIGSVKLHPEIISVTGPKSFVSKLSEVEIEIPLLNRELSFSEMIKPRLSFSDAEALETVMVEVEITPQRLRQEFPSVRVSGLSAVGSPNAGKIRITPATAKVILEGSESEIRAMESKLEVSTSVEGLKRGRYRLRGQVVTSGKIKVISIEPESFLVEVLSERIQK